jgi:hypothetical protein
MRGGAALSLAFAVTCALAAPALSAGPFEVHIRANPTLADVNAVVRVRLAVYAVTTNGRVLTDAKRFHLVAVSPLGERTQIALRHVGRGTWSGTIRPRTAGRWLIRISDWPRSGAVPTVPVHVRERPPLPSPN